MFKSELIQALQETLDVWGDDDVVLIDEIGTEYLIADAYQSNRESPFFLDIEINPVFRVEFEDE